MAANSGVQLSGDSQPLRRCLKVYLRGQYNNHFNLVPLRQCRKVYQSGKFDYSNRYHRLMCHFIIEYWCEFQMPR